MDLKIVAVFALFGVFVSVNGNSKGDTEKRSDWTSYEGKNWGVKVKPFVFINDKVKYGRLDGEVRYDINDRISVTGSGWRDTTRNWGAGVGFRYRWKREAGDMPQNLYHLRMAASPCQFIVYDMNMDGVVTLDEVLAVFNLDATLAEKLFEDLDGATGDGMITQDEFNAAAPKLIYGCVDASETTGIERYN